MSKRTATVNTPADCTVLVLQGGGALGAYQGGAFEAMVDADRQPDWVAGISIGAINSALIAGNPPEKRIGRLLEFWKRVTVSTPSPEWVGHCKPLRGWASDWAAAWTVAFGVTDFFTPRLASEFLGGAMSHPSVYDTGPLRQTLLELVDFKRLNRGPMRLSVGAVDVETGNFAYFDNQRHTIEPEHIMASGALPPGFPAVTIDGRAYWDGGLVSNTPLSHVVDNLDSGTATIFQVDLFSARGALPHTLAEVAEREKDIRYSSRTRAVTDTLGERHRMHRDIRDLAAMLPVERQSDPVVRKMLAGLIDTRIDVVHLIHRHKGADSQTKDYEFSRASMREHWKAGREDMHHSLRKLETTPAASVTDSFRTFDYNPRSSKGE